MPSAPALTSLPGSGANRTSSWPAAVPAKRRDHRAQPVDGANRAVVTAERELRVLWAKSHALDGAQTESKDVLARPAFPEPRCHLAVAVAADEDQAVRAEGGGPDGRLDPMPPIVVPSAVEHVDALAHARRDQPAPGVVDRRSEGRRRWRAGPKVT